MPTSSPQGLEIGIEIIILSQLYKFQVLGLIPESMFWDHTNSNLSKEDLHRKDDFLVIFPM